jgi:hypothetical protein
VVIKSTYYLLEYNAVYSAARQAEELLDHLNIQFTIQVERAGHLPFLSIFFALSSVEE